MRVPACIKDASPVDTPVNIRLHPCQKSVKVQLCHTAVERQQSSLHTVRQKSREPTVSTCSQMDVTVLFKCTLLPAVMLPSTVPIHIHANDVGEAGEQRWASRLAKCSSS